MAVTYGAFHGVSLGQTIFRLRFRKALQLGALEQYVTLTDYNPVNVWCDLNGCPVVFTIESLEEAEPVTMAQALKELNMRLTRRPNDWFGREPQVPEC
jgi:hypothetical protein